MLNSTLIILDVHKVRLQLLSWICLAILAFDKFLKRLEEIYGLTSYETKTLLELSKDLNYISNEIYINLEKQYDILARRLYTLIKKWQ